MDLPVALPAKIAVESLAESLYGFCLVDMGLREEDLALFDGLAIESTRDLHYFGEPENLVPTVASFLEAIGPNSGEVAEAAASAISRIAAQIVEASGKEMAWILLRASVLSHKYDLVHWHVDGYYYASLPTSELQYKFVWTLVGPPTLFYQVPKEASSVRSNLWFHMWDREYTSKMFSLDGAIHLQRDVGALLIAGDPQIAAVHSEPKMSLHRRLFFSLVPAHPDEIEGLKQRASQMTQ